jgi:DNA-binding transcriptional LysR family regulator
MEFMQMEMFVAVVQERSMRGAAERVFRSQPAVTIAMRKLEEEVGTALFDRSNRYQYTLTLEGEALYSYAVRMVGLRKEAMAALADISSVRTGRLRIGANEGVSLHLLPRLAEAFLRLHPGIHMEVTCERSENLLSKLKNRNLDLACVSYKPEEDHFESQFLMRDDLVLITHPLHSFAVRGRVEIRELDAEPLFAMDVSRQALWPRTFGDAPGPFGPPLNLSVESAPIETVKKMVALGLGVGFVPLMCVKAETARGELSVVTVQGLRQERSVWLVRRRETQSQSVKEFVDVAVSLGEGMLDSSAAWNAARAETKTGLAPAAQQRVRMIKRRA